jgi:hypothetical protein
VVVLLLHQCAAQHTVAEMARWPATHIVAEIREVLEAMDQLPIMDQLSIEEG